MIRLSRAERRRALVLVALTAAYLGYMAGNIVPHGADRIRQEQPAHIARVTP